MNYLGTHLNFNLREASQASQASQAWIGEIYIMENQKIIRKMVQK